MKNKTPLTMMLFLVLLAACKPAMKTEKAPLQDSALDNLVALMSGRFDSEKQSLTDENYYYISLKMKPIWLDRNDGKWLYVEQAVGAMLDKPYRQRIYHVTALSNNRFSSAVYELPDAQAVVGAFEDSSLLDEVTFDSLKLRNGCAVILSQSGPNEYNGSTQEKMCLSQLRGASYATSKVQITAAGISSWDQGFDNNDQQVWGATEGPYVFDRK